MSVRSLGTAASGIDTMQTDLDTIGNDIANSETDGFASQTAQFSDLLTEQLQPAGGAVGETLASTNPSAIGAGDEVSAIETNFSAGAVTQTGINSNVAIEGNGFLVVTPERSDVLHARR
jgi:flagellar hook protein FlgE